MKFSVYEDEAIMVRTLDSMSGKKRIYGAGLLLSEFATERHNAAKRLAEQEKQSRKRQDKKTECCSLSEREREIVKNLSKKALHGHDEEALAYTE